MTITWHGQTVELSIGWTSDPSVAIGSTTWTDESSKLRSIATSRGRSDELGTFQAGKATFVLDNRDRRFDPNYTAGPLYGNLLPMRRVRLLLNTVAVWHGFLDDIPQTYHLTNKDATVTLNCTDAFAVFALQKLPESVYAIEVTAANPNIWYRLGETYGTAAFDSGSDHVNGTYTGATPTSGLIFGGDDGAMTFDGVSNTVICTSPVTAFPFTIEMWVQLSDSAITAYLWSQVDIDIGRYMQITVQGGAVSAIVTDHAANTQSVTDTTAVPTGVGRVDDGVPHHIVVTFPSGSSAAIIAVDGAHAYSVFSATGTSGFPAGPNFQVAGFSISSPPGNSVTIDEFALYRGVTLLDATVISHYHGGHDPWTGDLSGARIGRYLDLVAWPAADRDIGTGVAVLQAAALAKQTVLPVMQNVELSEQGQLFMGADGKVVYRDRRWRFENTVAITSQATFGDDGTGAELAYMDIVTDGGAQFLRNHVIGSRQGGALVDATDSASITKFYERTDTDLSELQAATDDDVLSLVQWRVATRANPIARVTTLSIQPRHPTTGLIAAVLALDIGERVTVKRRPQGVGTALSYVVLVEGISHQLDVAGNWTCTLYLSSFDSLPTVQPLILDNATYGLLDTNVLAP